MITLSRLSKENADMIKSWPPYPPEFSELDYAIRDGGWLDMKGINLLSILVDNKLIGFVGLFKIVDCTGEILIALHTDYLGKGYGSIAMKKATQYYFKKYDLSQVNLCVRKTNPIAKHVYEKLGFSDCGESIRTIKGKQIEFYEMYITHKKLIGEN